MVVIQNNALVSFCCCVLFLSLLRDGAEENIGKAETKQNHDIARPKNKTP